MRLIRAIVLLPVAVLATSFPPTPSCADSWALPTIDIYTSPGGRARMVVTPRDLESQLAYFDDKVGGQTPAGQDRIGRTGATARMETLSGKRWEVVWEQAIANDVAPVTAIVRDDGRYAVTFDDWHAVGTGPHAVVIYGPAGERVRALALSDILPSDYIKALPHSVSSIRWRGDPRFSGDGRQVLVPIAIPAEDSASNPSEVEFAIDLADGTSSPTDRDDWTAALATGRCVLARQVTVEAATRAAFLAPLLGPNSNTQREWHEYLREAVGRSTGDDNSASTTVLRDPSASDYAVSEQWVRDALTDSYADEVALASLSETNLVSVLAEVGASTPRGSLSNVTAFIAISDTNWPRTVAALKGTGAKLVQLDPAEPILQRSDRITRRYGE